MWILIVWLWLRIWLQNKKHHTKPSQNSNPKGAPELVHVSSPSLTFQARLDNSKLDTLRAGGRVRDRANDDDDGGGNNENWNHKCILCVEWVSSHFLIPLALYSTSYTFPKIRAVKNGLYLWARLLAYFYLYWWMGYFIGVCIGENKWDFTSINHKVMKEKHFFIKVRRFEKAYLYQIR